jgi:hypothetical protein
VWLALAALAGSACGGDDSSGGADGGVSDGRTADARNGLDPMPDFTVTPATIAVRATADEKGNTSYTAVDGRFFAAAPPAPYADGAIVGSCRLSRYLDPLCDPACPFTSACTATDVCTPLPLLLSAGTLTLRGGDVERSLEPGALNHYGLGEVGALFPAGTQVSVKADGAPEQVPAFTIEAPMPAPLALDGDSSLALRTGEDYRLKWQPSGDDADRIRVQLDSDTASHGLFAPAILACDLPDAAGELTIPAALIDGFLEPKNWGCGDCRSSTVQRYRHASVEVEGRKIALWLASIRYVYIERK